MAWILTKGLQTLREQVNEAFPQRDKSSDGTVGDLTHQVGTSGHNPDLTGRAEYRDGDRLDEVRAWDMDADLRTPGVTTQQLVDHIRRLPGVGSVLRYIIFNRKIYRASAGWSPAEYSGPSPHTEHVHFSGAYSQAADSNTTFNYRLEDLVALSADDKTWLLNNLGPAKTWGYALEDPRSNPKATKSAGTYLRYGELVTVGQGDRIAAAVAALAGKDPVDEQAIVAGILAGLPPESIAAAIPDELAEQVAQKLADRLAS